MNFNQISGIVCSFILFLMSFHSENMWNQEIDSSKNSKVSFKIYFIVDLTSFIKQLCLISFHFSSFAAHNNAFKQRLLFAASLPLNPGS